MKNKRYRNIDEKLRYQVVGSENVNVGPTLEIPESILESTFNGGQSGGNQDPLGLGLK